MTNTILETLNNLGEKDYKLFNSKIIPTKQKMLGVRIPILRNLAKDIVKDKPFKFIELDKANSYEMIMLEGMVLSYMKKPFLELLPYIDNFLDKVDNWAQIDSVVCNFKKINKDEGLVVINKWLESDKEFVVRAGLVMLLDHYIYEEYLELIFKTVQDVKHKAYYVYMANAWLISVCMAKFPIQTIEFYKSNSLDSKTINKSIQKSRESFRVSKEHKALLLNYKKL